MSSCIVLLKLFALLALAGTALAGPGAWLEIINETPYEWKLVYQHSYQMDWRPVELIPAGIEAGGFNELYFEYWRHWADGGDDGAEATYAIMGSPTVQHFTIQARQKPRKSIFVEYHDTLESLGNPKNTRMELGWIHNGDKGGGLMFVLAGDDISNYVSSNPPTAWMQATLPTIGSKSLRDIAMPESHDAGISELISHWLQWLGTTHNTVTQTYHIYKQLLLGARWFDIRPAHYKGHWYTGHFSHSVGDNFVGGLGRTIEHIVDDINLFCHEHPGELIVLDLTHDYDVDNWIAPLNDELWQKLFRVLSRITDLWIPPKDNLPDDLSTVPISTFITPGSRSAVIVVLPDHVNLPQDPPKNRKRGSAYAETGQLYADLPRTPPPEPIHVDEAPEDQTNGFGDYEGWEDFEWTTWWLLFGNSSSPASNESPGNSSTPFIIEPDTPTNSTPHIFPRRVQSTLVTPITPIGPWAKAFINGRRVPSTGSYADSRHHDEVYNDQAAKLQALRTSPASQLHHSYWIRTQSFTDILDGFNGAHSITGMATEIQHDLLRDIWKYMKRGVTFPNLIVIDNVIDNSVAALCVVINKAWSTASYAVAVKRSEPGSFAKRRIAGRVETVAVNETLVDASD